MSYKDIEKSREIRLWIGQIIVPALTMFTVLYSNPNIRYAIKDKVNTIKCKAQNKFHKLKESKK